MLCRSCKSEDIENFLDLGFAPPSNAYINADQLVEKESYYPLKVRVCKTCWLVQTEDFVNRDELFTKDYAYLSSASKSWLSHCKNFATQSIKEFNLSRDSLVTEVASNDGYLLKYFKEKNIPSLGIESTKSTASIAKSYGLEVIEEFCTFRNAKKISSNYGKADLVIGNNVFAHVPDINDFTLGIKELMKTNGVLSIEFPHLVNLITFNQFDTIYHEYFSYLSLISVNNIFERAGLKIFNVEEIDTHGGSLRVYACFKQNNRKIQSAVNSLILKEKEFGIADIDTYKSFQSKVESIKFDFLELLLKFKKDNKLVMAYGAAAKGNTILNYCGIKEDLISCIFDAAESKQFKYAPGSHIPILPPSFIDKKIPDYLIIFPWNISKEISHQLKKYRSLGVKFITVIPNIEIF